MSNLLTLDGEETSIDTSVTFKDFAMQGSLQVYGLVNGFKIPDNVIVLTADQTTTAAPSISFTTTPSPSPISSRLE